ncbi:MAG: PAS domain-containing protein [Ktedonobacterales bacterium]|nr:PAS domain-containing protein [Ktedonobacterales bacterium]
MDIQRTSDAAPSVRAGTGGVVPSHAASDSDQAACALERLRHSEARFRALAAATGELPWMTNAAGLVEEDLPAWCAFTGQTPDEARGLGWLDALHPADRGRAEWERARDARVRYINRSRIRDAHGIYHHFIMRGVPIIEPDGAIREWVGVCQEIPDHGGVEEERARLPERGRRARGALAAHAAELEATLAAVGDALFVHDDKGRVIWLNRVAAEFLGVEARPDFKEMAHREQISALDLRDAKG